MTDTQTASATATATTAAESTKTVKATTTTTNVVEPSAASSLPQQKAATGTTDNPAAEDTEDQKQEEPACTPTTTTTEESSNNNNNTNADARFQAVPPGYHITENLLSAEAVYAVYNFVDGAYCVPSSGDFLANRNPATNQVISRIANSNAHDVDLAVQAAQRAFPAWAALTPEKRGEYLRRVANGIAKRLKAFAQLESRDNGKPFFMASIVDVPGAIKIWKYYAEQAKYMLDDALVRDDAVSYIQRPPLGVCGGITPWNYPLYLISNKIAPAIAYGNTVVVKPSELTPMTAYLLTDIFREVNLPPGVVNMVHGLGVSAGSPIVKHAGVRAISFTGGCVTGRKIAEMAGATMKKQHLELGGKNPTIICDDVDIAEILPKVAMAGFGNTGQICICGSRIFVHKKIAAQFTEALCAFVSKNYTAKIGNPQTSMYGCLVSLPHRSKVEGYVQLAQEEGGKILIGGKRPSGLQPPFDEGAFYEPTIVTGLSPSSRCATEEIFGPVVTIHEWETEDEVIAYANCTNYGLSASVWTNNLKRGHRMAARIESGMVWVNCWAAPSRNILPFGGVKGSGNGRENGKYSREFYTECKNIVIML